MSEAYLEGMKTGTIATATSTVTPVRSLPRRNENLDTGIIANDKPVLSEAYLEGMKTVHVIVAVLG